MQLPITHITLYKHGVGFFERRGQVQGEAIELTFREEEMNDVLKSLIAIDAGPGQVLGVDFATLQSREERLAGCSVRLGSRRSLRDLLRSLRGRRVTLRLRDSEPCTGTLVGLDEPAKSRPLDEGWVSLLVDDSEQVMRIALGQLQGVEIRDERGAADLRYFLKTSLGQERDRHVTLHLTPGSHELMVGYVAPAPTWRVSYRLVLDESGALLLGWGIFDNSLDEDLRGISLSLVAGMPISFIYDLYTPFTPERPLIKETGRAAAAPVAFEAAQAKAAPQMLEMVGAAAPAPAPPIPRKRAVRMSRDSLAEAQPVAAQGESLGELFQYVIQTPVTVGRGQSAMVPIVSADLRYRKDLLYNGAKQAAHPVATLRVPNDSGLTLERGPVTVVDDGEYVGEAILPFTAAGGEIVVPYAVELGVEVKEERRSRRELYRLAIKGAYMNMEEWDIRQRIYRLHSKSGRELAVLIEHPRSGPYELFQTPSPAESTPSAWRFAVNVPPYQSVALTVQERRLVSRSEELRRQTHASLQRYLQQGLMNRRQHDRLIKLLTLYDALEDYAQKLQRLAKEREQLYRQQEQIRENLGALGQTGQEGALRGQYVARLQASEAQLQSLNKQEAELKAMVRQVERDIEARLKAL